MIKTVTCTECDAENTPEERDIKDGCMRCTECGKIFDL